MKQGIHHTGIFLTLLTLAGSSVACRQASALAGEVDVPTAVVKEADVQLKVLTTGALRTKESRAIAAPPIAGGTLQIIKLARFGSQVHKGDVVLEFDPSEQEYNLAQSRSDLMQAEQEIAKSKADAAVQTAEDARVMSLKKQEEELRAHVRDRLAHHKCPRDFHFVDSLPKTATGKIQRYLLREAASRRPAPFPAAAQ